MRAYCPQDRTTVDVKDLHRTAVVSREAQLPVRTNLATPRDLLEPRDRLDHSVRFWRVDLEASARGNDVAVRRGRREVDVGDGRVGLEEHGGL